MISIEIRPPTGLLAYPDLVAQVLPEIAEAVRSEIVALAQRELHTSASDYEQGLNLLLVRVGPSDLKRRELTFATIVLTGWLANAVEQGISSFDMKEGLLQGRNAKRTKDGKRYNVVPFRHGTPGSSGRYFAPMGGVHGAHGASGSPGGMSRSDAEQLGRKVHRIAQALAPTTSHPSTGTQWGGRVGEGNAPKLTNRTSGYEHKTDIFAGMVRKEKTYEKATQNQYTTFRAVSDNSDPGAWVHPGIIRHDLFGRAGAKIPAIAARLFQGALAGIGR